MRIISGLLDVVWRLGSRRGGLSDDERQEAVRAILRRFPYWPTGHRELALISLKVNNVALAYSAALTYELLSRDNPRARCEGLLIIGQCFLRRADPQRALNFFEQARSLGLDTTQLAEETAAAHILKGTYDAALSSLLQIPSERLSAEGKAALHFVRARQQQNV